MTEKPKPNNSTEPVSQEDNLELARSLLKQGSSIEEVVASSGLNRNTVLGLKGAIVRANKRLEAASKPTEAETKPQIQIQAENKPQENKTIPSEPARPSGAVEVSPQFWDELDELDKKSLKGWKANVLAWNDLQKQRVQRNDGHDVPSYSSADEDLKRAKARTEDAYAEMLRDATMRERLGYGEKTKGEQQLGIKDIIEIVKLLQGGKGESLGIKDTLELAKFLGGSNTKETLQLVDFIMQAREKGQAITLSDITLKLEELKQTHDVEMAKLGFEEKKWEYKMANEGKMMEKAEHLIKTVSEGPIGKAIENLGAGAADRVRGGPKVAMVDVQCPNCQNKFRANSNLPQVMCLNCGAMLQKPSEPQTQELPSTQPSKEEVSSEQPIPQIPQENVEKPRESEVI
jgi:ribosomal protein S27E